jgi:hypothetical protein
LNLLGYCIRPFKESQPGGPGFGGSARYYLSQRFALEMELLYSWGQVNNQGPHYKMVACVLRALAMPSSNPLSEASHLRSPIRLALYSRAGIIDTQTKPGLSFPIGNPLVVLRVFVSGGR